MNAKPTLQERIAKMSPTGQEIVRLIADVLNSDPSSVDRARELFNERTRGMRLWEAAAIKEMAVQLATENLRNKEPT